MIGFLFLTYDNIYNETIWMEYFKNEDPSRYKLFIHPKTPHLIKNQSLFKNCIIPKRCKTEWGKFSLIKAQTLLMEEALKTPEIKHVILISHNSLPTTSFSCLYNFLNNKGSVFFYEIARNPDHAIRYSAITNPIFSTNNFYTQGQWCILSREDCEILVNEYTIFKNIFKSMKVPDEHVYVNYLIHYKHRSITNQNIVYIEWENSSPKIFHHLPDDFIQNVKNTGCFFIRKVEDNAIMDVNHLLS
jgi:hypothetical protein